MTESPFGKIRFPATAEDAAAEYFTNRFMGDYAPKPPVHRWCADQRERFEPSSPVSRASV